MEQKDQKQPTPSLSAASESNAGDGEAPSASARLQSGSFNAGDRVRLAGTTGPLGTVKKVRMETIRQSIRESESEPPGVTVTVLWDNGTLSHFVPEGLETVV